MWVAVFTVLFVVALSLFVIRLATVALTLTGLSKDLAQFQSLSAFTGSGFTTRESEEIVNHPVRRRIVMHLMLLGNAGIVIAVSSVMLSFFPRGDTIANLLIRLNILLVGIILLWVIASSRHIENVLWKLNSWALRRWTHIEVHDYTRLMRLSHDYVVWEMQVQPDNWLAGHTLSEIQLANEGILVLGIERADGEYHGAPRGGTRIEAGDSLILYGRQETLLDLDEREPGMAGNLRHVIAVSRQLDEWEVADEEKESTGADIRSGR